MYLEVKSYMSGVRLFQNKTQNIRLNIILKNRVKTILARKKAQKKSPRKTSEARYKFNKFI